jgi:hypothetical protein
MTKRLKRPTDIIQRGKLEQSAIKLNRSNLFSVKPDSGTV